MQERLNFITKSIALLLFLISQSEDKLMRLISIVDSFDRKSSRDHFTCSGKRIYVTGAIYRCGLGEVGLYEGSEGVLYRIVVDGPM